MRIIAGRLGGRTLVRPKTPSTRPMSDKVREALFNLIGSVEGLEVLDAYAGSGAVGLEAISRGAARVTFIESAATAQRVINQNVASLGVTTQTKVMAAPVAKVLKRLETYDLVLADPPYDELDPVEISALGQKLAATGTLVLSHSSRMSPPTLESMERQDTRIYGDSALSFYRKV